MKALAQVENSHPQGMYHKTNFFIYGRISKIQKVLNSWGKSDPISYKKIQNWSIIEEVWQPSRFSNPSGGPKSSDAHNFFIY